MPHFLWQGDCKSPRVEVPDEVLDEGLCEWENALVAQLLGKIPNYNTFQKSVELLWGEKMDLRPARRNSKDRDQVLEKRPWHIQGQPLIVRKWVANLEILDTICKKLHVWVHLKGIPLELFTRNGIGYIASVIGVPLYIDKVTAGKRDLNLPGSVLNLMLIRRSLVSLTL